VAYGNGTFVAVGNGGTILTSPDGVSWTQRTSGTSNSLSGVTYRNGTFVAVGLGGTILTSPDGVTWTQRTSGTRNWLSGVTYGNGPSWRWGDGPILTSPDGVNWTARANGDGQQALGRGLRQRHDSLRGVAYGNGTFVGTGGTILTSPDGVNWTVRASGTATGSSAWPTATASSWRWGTTAPSSPPRTG
jgi:hypothetical protein